MIRAPYQITRKVVQPKAILAIDPTVAFERITALLTELEDLKAQHTAEHRATIKEMQTKHTEKIVALDKKIVEAEQELLRTKEIKKGDKGDVGDMPNIPDIVKAVLPYIPAFIPEPIKGDKGDTPDPKKIIKAVLKEIPPSKLPEVDHEKVADRVVEILKKEKKITTEHITGLKEEMASYRNQLAGKHYGTDTMVRGGGDRVKAGTNVTIVDNSDGTRTIASSGGAAASIYTETPTGAIDGNNTTYTTLHSITTVIGMWINGEFIHPSEYTALGAGFTMGTALNASLSAASFTISYT